jgi:hypothetical protein
MARSSYPIGKVLRSRVQQLLQRSQWDGQGDAGLHACLKILQPIAGAGLLDYKNIDQIQTLLPLQLAAMAKLGEPLSMWSESRLEEGSQEFMQATICMSRIPLQSDYMISEGLVGQLVDLLAKVDELPSDLQSAGALQRHGLIVELRDTVDVCESVRAQVVDDTLESASAVITFIKDVATPKLRAVPVDTTKVTDMCAKLETVHHRSSVWDSGLAGLLDALDLVQAGVQSYSESFPEFLAHRQKMEAAGKENSGEVGGSKVYLESVISLCKHVHLIKNRPPCSYGRRSPCGPPEVCDKVMTFVADSTFGRNVYQVESLSKITEAVESRCEAMHVGSCVVVDVEELRQQQVDALASCIRSSRAT